MQRSTEPLLRAAGGDRAAAAGRRELRRRLHAEPELAHAEWHTAALVAGAAARQRDRRRHGPDRADRPAGRPGLAVRAELDGLPLSERTGAAFSARGATMHACGHDVHMAALVALARAATASGSGCRRRCWRSFSRARSAIPRAPSCSRAVSSHGSRRAAVLGVHVQPELPWGTLALDAGAVNASCDTIEITSRASRRTAPTRTRTRSDRRAGAGRRHAL